MDSIERYMDKENVKTWPAKRKNRLLILQYLASKFENDKIYTEKEVNEIINKYQTFGDHATIRRDLFDYFFLNRDLNGATYWKDKKTVYNV